MVKLTQFFKLTFLLSLSFFSLKAAPTRILFIGNSYVYANDLPQVLYNLALSGGDTIVFSSSAPGGYTFAQHTTNTTTLSLINSQPWDFVILQEQSQMPAFPPGQVASGTYPYAAQLNDLILAHDSCTQVVFYMTWGRKYGDPINCPNYPPLCTFEGMQDRLRHSYLQMGDDNQAMVAPVGEAFKYLRMADSTLNLYTTDNSHPSLAGTYLAACTFYATIFQNTPVGLSYTAGLPASQVALLQQTASQTVFDSLSVWNINEFTPHALFSHSQSVVTANQVTFTNNSTNALQYSWDFGDGTISDQKDPVHVYTGVGTYTVTLTVFDGCRESTMEQQILVSPLGVQDKNTLPWQVISEQGQIRVINPNSVTDAHLSVFTTTGQLIFTTRITQNKANKIDTSSWGSGVYLIQIQNGNYSQLIKAFVE